MNKDTAKVKNIFLADDDADDRDFFKEALEQVSVPTQLTVSRDGLELMINLEAVLTPPPPHVIFLDLNMPRKNGFECLQQIRTTPKLKDIPVIIFSTTAHNDAVDKTYHQGANYYIHKPRTFQLLVKAIETILTMEMWQKPQTSKDSFVLAIA
jgi:CheY-like chemotaxis protein